MIQEIVIDVIKNIEVEVAEKTKISTHTILSNNDFIEENKIVCGDAIKLLEQVKPNSIHLVLSDIPYGIALDEWDVFTCKHKFRTSWKITSAGRKKCFQASGESNQWVVKRRSEHSKKNIKIGAFLGRISYILWWKKAVVYSFSARAEHCTELWLLLKKVAF